MVERGHILSWPELDVDLDLERIKHPERLEMGFQPSGTASVEFRDIILAVDLRFYLDPENGQAHIRSRGVAEQEVEQVLKKPIEDRAGRDGSRVAVGQTSAGRYLRVIYVVDQVPDRLFVITAYELRGKPLDALRRRRRKKHSP